MFIDEVKIMVKAGDGGNGCMAFRREKFVPRGGPSGGDGGRGGDITLKASPHHNTLLHFRFNPEHKAERGRHGEGSNRKGADGAGITLPVPVGTVVYDEATGEVLHDFVTRGETFIVAKGGRGGRGNARFTTPTHQAPTEHEDGKPGEMFNLRLELKLLADVGLVGYPNAGKSTLISRLSAAKPKIADYPFTTLTPNLGVMSFEDLTDSRTLVIADIPGLIEGASEGHGLGHQFLRHVERTRVLVHLVDVSGASGRDPLEDYRVILDELARFSSELAAKPQIVCANKMDAAQDLDVVAALEEAVKGHAFLSISAVAGTGLKDLKKMIFEMAAEGEEPLEPPAPRIQPVKVESLAEDGEDAL